MRIDVENFKISNNSFLSEDLNFIKVFDLEIPLSQIPLIKTNEFNTFKMLNIGNIIILARQDFRNNIDYYYLIEQDVKETVSIKNTQITVVINDNNPLLGLLAYNKEYFENLLYNVFYKELSDIKYFKIYENLFRNVNVVKLEDNVKKDKYFYKGKSYNTLTEIEREFNLSKGLLHHRINKMNLTLEEAIERPIAKVGRGASKRKKETKETKEKFNYDGELFTLDELVDLSGLRKDTLYRRLKRGWSVKEAIETPAQATGRGGIKHV